MGMDDIELLDLPVMKHDFLEGENSIFSDLNIFILHEIANLLLSLKVLQNTIK